MLNNTEESSTDQPQNGCLGDTETFSRDAESLRPSESYLTKAARELCLDQDDSDMEEGEGIGIDTLFGSQMNSNTRDNSSSLWKKKQLDCDSDDDAESLEERKKSFFIPRDHSKPSSADADASAADEQTVATGGRTKKSKSQRRANRPAEKLEGAVEVKINSAEQRNETMVTEFGAETETPSSEAKISDSASQSAHNFASSTLENFHSHQARSKQTDGTDCCEEFQLQTQATGTKTQINCVQPCTEEAVDSKEQSKQTQTVSSDVVESTADAREDSGLAEPFEASDGDSDEEEADFDDVVDGIKQAASSATARVNTNTNDANRNRKSTVEEEANQHDGDQSAAKSQQLDATDEQSKPSEEETETKESSLSSTSKNSISKGITKTGADSTKSMPELKLPSEEQLISSTDALFVQADMETVTVKNVVESLEVEFDIPLPKAIKKWVRSHLKDLVEGTVEPSVPRPSDERTNLGSGEDSDDPVSDQGDSESDFDEGDNASDDEDFAGGSNKGNKSKKKQKRKAAEKSTKSSSKRTTVRHKRPPSLSKAQRQAAKEARQLTKELKKRRMEELKVRNEELQATQTKEDQERAEAIATRLETDTPELRCQRLEDRLNLLQRLDERRITIVKMANTDADNCVESPAGPSHNENHANDQVDEKHETTEVHKEKLDGMKAEAGQEIENTINRKEGEEHSEESESDSDDEELEIEAEGSGPPKRLSQKPLEPMQFSRSTKALAFLENKGRSPQPGQCTSAGASSTLPSPTRNLLSNSRQGSAASSRNIDGRASLRNILLQKQRKMGNRWLARELGYKTEHDHLEDCQKLEEKKRNQVLIVEQRRLESNERKLLRERILLQESQYPGEIAEDDTEASGHVEAEAETEEVDEEMELAKQLADEGKESKGASSILQESSDATQTDRQRSLSASNFDAVPAAGKNDISEGIDAQAPDEAPDAGIQSTIDDMTKQEGFTGNNVLHGVSVKIAEVRKSTECDENTQSGSPKTAADDSGKSTSTDKEIFDDADDEEEEGDDNDADEGDKLDEKANKVKKPRNAMWQAMLQKEAQSLKKQKLRKGANGLVELEAEEEEEEEVAGLEDFGFKVKKKNQDGEDDDDDGDKLEEDDLDHIVDDVSDDEGDEQAGDNARKLMEQDEEKRKHKDIIRRMREGYDGRRGGIAGGGLGARGNLRFDQLVAADNREDAKRLGLLNDDELDSEDEFKENKEVGNGDPDEEEDEAAILDKMLKDRFLHRSGVEIEEDFSDDEENETKDETDMTSENQDHEEQTQERLAKRFAKRARMQRLEDELGDSNEFSQQRLIDEDESMRLELQQMKNGLIRKRSISASRSSFSSDSNPAFANSQSKRPRSNTGNASSFSMGTGSLSIALRANRRLKKKTSFLGGKLAGDKSNQQSMSISRSQVVFGASTKGK